MTNYSPTRTQNPLISFTETLFLIFDKIKGHFEVRFVLDQSYLLTQQLHSWTDRNDLYHFILINPDLPL